MRCKQCMLSGACWLADGLATHTDRSIDPYAPWLFRLQEIRHDAQTHQSCCGWFAFRHLHRESATAYSATDRKSTRLNSSHQIISYAVFCLKKKKKKKIHISRHCAQRYQNR